MFFFTKFDYNELENNSKLRTKRISYQNGVKQVLTVFPIFAFVIFAIVDVDVDKV